MNKILSLLLDVAYEAYLQPLVDLLRGKVAVYYVEAVHTARTVLITLGLLIFCVTLMAAGAAVIPFALCMYMPWEPETKAIVAASFGASYLLIPFIAVTYLLSKKRWMRITKADQLMEQILKKP